MCYTLITQLLAQTLIKRHLCKYFPTAKEVFYKFFSVFKVLIILSNVDRTGIAYKVLVFFKY